jgi:hypothetical protein
MLKAQNLKYSNDDEPILRRLGGATVVLWDRLPKDARALIREQAIFMHDRHQTVQLAQQIDMFIEKHKLKAAAN